jgi:hypothetical protein
MLARFNPDCVNLHQVIATEQSYTTNAIVVDGVVGDSRILATRVTADAVAPTASCDCVVPHHVVTTEQKDARILKVVNSVEDDGCVVTARVAPDAILHVILDLAFANLVAISIELKPVATASGNGHPAHTAARCKPQHTSPRKVHKRHAGNGRVRGACTNCQSRIARVGQPRAVDDHAAALKVDWARHYGQICCEAEHILRRWWKINDHDIRPRVSICSTQCVRQRPHVIHAAACRVDRERSHCLKRKEIKISNGMMTTMMVTMVLIT